MSDKQTNRNLNDIIVERIRASFGELMTEEEWRGVVASTITTFKSPVKDYHGARPSPLEQLVTQEIKNRMLEEIKKNLTSHNFNVQIESVGYKAAGEIINNLVRDNADMVLKAMTLNVVKDVTAQVVFQIEQQLKNAGQAR